MTLPPNIPARAFWSFTVYDNQTRSMLDTPQRYPRAGSQSWASEHCSEGCAPWYLRDKSCNPRSRGLSEHRVFFCGECCIPPMCKGGNTKGGWSPETLPDIVTMTATTFLSSKELSCPVCTLNQEKLPLREQKSHGSTRLLERGL
jgi:hypothetical protein